MIIYVDIDNTITKTIGEDYKNAMPDYTAIDRVNNLFNAGHVIIYWTARGVGRVIDFYDMTKEQLDSWGCKYHALRTDKPVYDAFIDDKNFNTIKQFEEKNEIN